MQISGLLGGRRDRSDCWGLFVLVKTLKFLLLQHFPPLAYAHNSHPVVMGLLV